MLPLHQTLAIVLLVLTSTLAQAQNNFWQSLNGPGGIQSIYGLAEDVTGQIFIARAYDVYRSADNGNSWVECDSGLPTYLYFKSFILSPAGHLYLALDYSDGLFRYVPATDAWVNVPTPAGTWGNLDDIDIDPQGRIWASIDEPDSKVYYSDNQGQSFQQIPLDTALQGSFQGMATFNDDHNLIFAGTSLYHFNSAGAIQLVLNTIPSLPPRFFGYNPHTGTAFYSSNTMFKRSSDGGLNWQNVNLEPNAPIQPIIDNITFESAAKIWVHTYKGLYWSSDDGITWTKDANFDDSNERYIRANSGKWYTTNSCNYPNLAFTEDNGAGWTDLSGSFKQPYVEDIRAGADGALYARTCRRGAYEISHDGGQSWEDLAIPVNNAPVYVSSLAARPDGVMLAAGKNDRYYRSANNGNSWEDITDDLNAPGAGVFTPRFYTDYNGAFYWFDEFGNGLKSTNNGNSWQPLGFGLDIYYSSPGFHPNGDVYWTDGTLAKVYVANENLTKWIGINNQPLFQVMSLHCTASGVTYLSGLAGLSSSSLFRILPDGSYTPEPIPYFDGNFNVLAITSNVEGDVFVVAGQNVYRSEDEGLTWEIIGTMPVGAYPTMLYVSPDQYLYAGFNGTVIHRSSQPIAENNFILGKVWLDNNGDCIHDAGEPYRASVAVTATGSGDYTSFSGYNGNFTLTAPTGSYLLGVKPPNDLFEPCLGGIPFTLDGPNDSVFADVPLKAAILCPYMSVSLSAPLLRRCFDVTYTVRYKNEGTAPASGAYVEVTLDSMFVFLSSSLPVAAQSGFAYTFNVGEVEPGQSGSFNIVLTVSCEASLGQLHCIEAHIFPDQLCLPTLPPRAYYRECRANIGSFDPNDKRAFVDGIEEPGYVLPNTDIEYLIRFQNTGTDTAFRVVVEDRLSTLLDLTSVTPLVSSHPFTMEVRDQRVLRFVFDNILLPDSNINEAASHGFIKFRVSQIPNVPLGSVIKNSANIFFDFNLPVGTNESNLVVGTVGTEPEPGNPYVVTAYPNPFGDQVTIEIAGPALPGNATLRLFDALGRQVRREEFAGDTFVIQRHTMETGVYFFLVESEGKTIGSGKVEAR